MIDQRMTLFAVLALALTACGGQSEVAEQSTCDRDCILDVTETYLSALVAHNPDAAPLADNIAFVENVTKMQPGEGLWEAAISGPTDFAIYVPDTEQQQAGFVGIMSREGEDGPENIMLAVRLKIENGEIVEAEHLVSGVTDMERLTTPRSGLTSEVPEAQRISHDELAAIGLTYYDALDDNDGSLMPFADDCQRHENGMVTAGPEAGGGPNSNPDHPVANLCAPQLDSQSFVYIEDIDNRRLIAADPVTGLALGFSHFRHSFENLPYDVIRMDGSTVERNGGNMPYSPFDMPAAHIFKIDADGLVHEIEAVGVLGVPHMAPTGWE